MRYADHGALDESAGQEGDRAFQGVNSKLHPALLNPGFVAEAVNLVMRTGAAKTRPGTVTPAAQNAADYGTILGSAVFSDPDTGDEWLLIATASDVYKTRDGSWPQPIGIGDATFAAAVEMVQAFDRVLLLRAGETPLAWDGSDHASFAPVDQTPAGDGTEPIPNAPWGVVTANRLVVPVQRDRLAISDLLDYTRWDPILSELRINAGTRDAITAIVPDQARQSLIVFRESSIFIISNFYGDLSDLRIDLVNGALGCVARQSAVRVGAEILFLSRRGVYAVSEVIEARLATSPVPVSDPIEPLLRRVNWPAAANACAVVFDEYYWLAVPLDGSTVNNAVMRFNLTTRQWEGYDQWAAGAAVQIDRWHVLEYQSRPALHAIDNANGRVIVFGQGLTDLIDGTEYQISTTLLSRAYGGAVSGVKGFRRVSLDVDTWNARFTLAARPDGVQESEELVSNRTRSRTGWHVFGNAPYEESNGGDNHAAPYRQDYSIQLADGAAEFDPQAGVDPELKQTTKERFVLRHSRGSTLQIAMTNDRGSLALRELAIDGTETERNTRSRAA